MRQRLSNILKILDGQPRAKRGQSMVEMALTAPFLIIMVLGLVELGFFANDYLILLDAIRSASRSAVNLDPSQWTYQDAHNFNRMDCDTNNHGAMTGPNNSIYLYQPGENISNPAVVGAPYGQRADAPQNPSNYPIALGARGQHLTSAPWAGKIHNGSFTYSFRDRGDGPFGFFDAVACQVVLAMSPLHLQDVLDAAGKDKLNADNTPYSKDDIVISAVSYITMNYTGVPAGSRGPLYNPGGPGGHGDYYVAVTARWPLESRFCNIGGKGDARDPFDYMRNDFDKDWNNGQGVAPNADGTSQDNQTTLALPLHPTFEGPVTNPKDFDTVADPATNLDYHILNPAVAGDSQGVRGYMFTGNHQVDDGSGCWGSEFTVQDIEQRLNLALDTSSGVAPNLDKSAPNDGLVIVEVFWQYHPLFFGPLFQGFNSKDSQKDPVMHIWSFYPAPHIEPTITPAKPLS